MAKSTRVKWVHNLRVDLLEGDPVSKEAREGVLMANNNSNAKKDTKIRREATSEAGYWSVWRLMNR